MPEALTRPANAVGGGSPASTKQIRVLSLSCVYPNPRETRLGIFVQSRLRRLSDLAPLKVVAPIPQIDYARSRIGRRDVPQHEWDGTIEIFRPAWLYPPGGNCFNAVLLFLRLLPLAAALRKRYPFDIIDAHFAFPDGAAAGLLAAALNLPFAVTLRGNETMHARYSGRRRLMAWSLRRASAVITLSEELRRLALALGVEERRIRTIPNGIDAQIFYPRGGTFCRQKHSLDPDAKIVLSAGSLIERKGHHRTMRAAAALSKTGRSVILLIAGGPGREGRYEAELRQQAAELEGSLQVRFLGEVAPGELAELMSAADLFCLASSREGWPNVVHESLACGTPVVAARVGAVAEMIPSTGYGLVVPPDDPAALERALREAIEKAWDHNMISRWAHARSWEHAAQEVYQVFLDNVGVGQMGKESA
jgi:glycosyltransferase involved in cell wall biosynthesis